MIKNGQNPYKHLRLRALIIEVMNYGYKSVG